MSSKLNIELTFIKSRQPLLRIIGGQTCRARSRSSLHTPHGGRTTQRLAKRVRRISASASSGKQFCTSAASCALLGACKHLIPRHEPPCSRASSPVEGEIQLFWLGSIVKDKVWALDRSTRAYVHRVYV